MINIAELLKDAPEGMKLYSPLLGEVEFAEVMDTKYMPIRVMKRGYGLRFDEYGRYMGNEYPDSECLLFPSKDRRTWEGWKLPVQPKFNVGDDIKTGNTIDTVAEVDYATRSYCCKSGRTIWFENQDLWHLAPKPHYDIKNFKPFDHCRFKPTETHDWIYADFWYVQAHYKVEHLSTIEKWES